MPKVPKDQRKIPEALLNISFLHHSRLHAAMEQIACNYLAALALPPWTRPVRHQLYLTYDGEERTPFGLYVQPTDSKSQSSESLPFTDLSGELQLHILSFCSVPTLFQLMHVSSHLRKEARKVFWANPDTYFVIQALWLLSGGYPGNTHKDLGFLSNVQNVQVDVEGTLYDDLCPEEHGTAVIAYFWETLQKRCPKVKRVIINQTKCYEEQRMETQFLPEGVRLLVKFSPPEITASAFIVERTDAPAGIDATSSLKWQRAMYTPRSDGHWDKTKSAQDWKSVFVPPKPWSGLAGRVFELKNKASLIRLQEHGLWLVMAEILDRYFSESGEKPTFSCTSRGCNADFQTVGEWSVHEAGAHDVLLRYQHWMSNERFTQLPEVVRGRLTFLSTNLRARADEIDGCVADMREEWDESSPEQQREMSDLFADQMENDPLWDSGKSKKYLHWTYKRALTSFF